MDRTEFKTKYFALRLAISKMSLQLIAISDHPSPDKRDTYQATYDSLVDQRVALCSNFRKEYMRKSMVNYSKAVAEKSSHDYIADTAKEYEEMDRAASVLIKLAYEKAGALTG